MYLLTCYERKKKTCIPLNPHLPTNTIAFLEKTSMTFTVYEYYKIRNHFYCIFHLKYVYKIK